MRIAYVTADPGVPVFGRKGSSVHVQEVVRAFRRAGHTVEVFTSRPGEASPADLADITVHRLPRPTGDAAARERAAQRANADLAAALARTGPFDLVYERYSLWSTAAIRYARRTASRSVLEVNAPLVDEQAAHRCLLDRAGAEAVAAEVLRTAGTVVAVSDAVAVWTRSRGATRVSVVPNGVDPARFTPRSHVEREPGRGLCVGFVGTLKPWHGVSVLVDAFTRLVSTAPGYRLRLVGDGPERAAVQRQAAAAGVSDNVELVGAVDPCDVPGLLSEFDVAVAPYPVRDEAYFSPLKVFEYLAAGLPVVASRVGQVEEIVGRCGLLVPPSDARALAQAIEVVRADPQLAQRLSRRGRELVEAAHSWDAVAARILAIAGLGVAQGTAA